MRRYCLAFAFLLAAWQAHAIDITRESPIGRVGVAVTVSVSTSAWTKANSTTSFLSSRSGYKVSVPATDTSAMFALCKPAGTSPTEATSVGPVEIDTGENPFIPCGPGLDLYLRSLNTSAENAHVWEVGQ